MTIAANVITNRKACSVNPLKSSAPLGAAMAYLGMEGCLPLFHGSQGCTAFALVLMVRHFREAIPVQTTAMSEISTILGGIDNVEQALVTIAKRAKPKLIGICSTGLTETRGEDVGPELKLIKARNPDLDGTAVVFAATPDYVGGLQEGWAVAVTAMIEAFVPEGPQPQTRDRITILAGSHLTPGDIEELRDIAAAFGLETTVLPDLSGSLDGHVPDDYSGTTYGGTRLEDMATLGTAAATLAFGAHMRRPAEALEARTGVPTHMLDLPLGLAASDALVKTLSEISGRPVPQRLRRQRSQLVDALLDSHFYFGGRTVALAAEPDLLGPWAALFAGLGAEVAVAVSTVSTPELSTLPARTIMVGDLEDLETAAAETGASLLVTHAHGRQASARLGVPLYRVGFPSFDRIGSQHRVSLGYRGTRDRVLEIANLFLDILDHDHHTHDEGEKRHVDAHAASC